MSKVNESETPSLCQKLNPQAPFQEICIKQRDLKTYFKLIM